MKHSIDEALRITSRTICEKKKLWNESSVIWGQTFLMKSWEILTKRMPEDCTDELLC